MSRHLTTNIFKYLEPSKRENTAKNIHEERWWTSVCSASVHNYLIILKPDAQINTIFRRTDEGWSWGGDETDRNTRRNNKGEIWWGQGHPSQMINPHDLLEEENATSCYRRPEYRWIRCWLELHHSRANWTTGFKTETLSGHQAIPGWHSYIYSYQSNSCISFRLSSVLPVPAVGR